MNPILFMNELLLLIYKSDKKCIQYKQERRVKEADRDGLNLDLFLPVQNEFVI